MRRTSTMTLGFVLIFIGVQLAIVDSYVLTPRVANFLSENGTLEPAALPAPLPQQAQNPYSASPYNQISYQQPVAPVIASTLNQRKITPPGWLCWPMLFWGTVVFIHGFSKPRD